MKHSKKGSAHPHSAQRSSSSRSPIIEAAIEIGHAAESLRDSLGHMKKARTKGASAMRPIQRAGKKTIHAVRRTIKKTTGY